MLFSQIKVVFLVALKQECPDEFPSTIAHCTLRALLSGDTRSITPHSHTMVMITGVGKDNALSAAKWVCEHTKPLFVINYGTCGGYKVDTSKGSIVHFAKTPPPLNQTLPHTPYPLYSTPNQASPCFIDMESEHYQGYFSKYPIPFYPIKMVSDHHDYHLDIDFQNQLHNTPKQFKKTFNFLYRPTITSNNVSVIIPTYNRAHLVERSIQSVLSQTMPAGEIIVIDDGSTDTTHSVLSTYQDHISIIRIPHNNGVSHARNQGIAHATKEWIMLLDSDDEWHPEKISSQLDFLNDNPFYWICQTDEKWVKNNQLKNKPKHLHKKNDWIFKDSLQRCMVSPSSVCFHQSIWQQHGPFNDSFPACEDYDLWIKISRTHPVGLIPSELLTRYAGHSDQLSATTPIQDQYRIQSLLNCYQNETDSDIKKMIKHTLTQKLTILINGTQKRGHDSQYYQQLLDSIEIEPITK